MKITLLQENLQQVMQDIQKAVPSRPQLPILACIFISAEESVISFAVTDLQFGVRSHVHGEVRTPGKIAVPAKIFMDVVSSFRAGKIDFSFEGQTLTIKNADSVVKVQCFPAEDYPAFPEKEGEEISLPYSSFSQAVQSTAFAASVDEARPVLTTILLSLGETFEMVGTDGFRLSTITLPYSGQPLKLLLPARAVSEVVRIASKKKTETVVFSVSEQLKQVFFSFEGVEILVRIMDGEFPPYQKIIPVDFSTQIIIDAEELSQKLKTASIFARESSGIIKLVIDQETLKVCSSSSTLGNQESSLPIQLISGGNQEIAFNMKYLQDFLSVLKPEKVWMGMNESLKPALFRPEGMENCKYIVMPFRVNQ
jgi:DNA polymerase-3 subunit beta